MVEVSMGVLPREVESYEDLSPQAKRMWPTPRAADFKGAQTASALTARRVESGEANLCEAVVESQRMWPTPNASPVTFDGPNCSGDGRTTPNKLGWAVAEAEQEQEEPDETTLWPTPRATRGGSATETVKKMFPTPTAPAPHDTENTVGKWRKPRDGYGEELANAVHDTPLWPTPTAKDTGRSVDDYLEMKANMPGGARSTITSLAVAVKATEEGRLLPMGDDDEPVEDRLWPTPTTRDRGSDPPNREGSPSLAAAVREMWPTPNAADSWVPEETTENTLRRGDPNGSERTSSGSLAKEVHRFPTPQARDYRSARKPDSTRNTPDLNDVVVWATPTAHPRTHTPRDVDHGEQLANQVGGQLNPTWVEWLMGFPIGWTDLDA
jgi:hypothetical protein